LNKKNKLNNMHAKSYLIPTLFFAITILSVFSAKSQNASDTIAIVKKGVGVNFYYYEGNQLNLHQLGILQKQ